MVINDEIFVFVLYIKDLKTNNDFYEKEFDTLELLNDELEKDELNEPFDCETIIQICSKHENNLCLLFEWPLDMVFPLDSDEIEEIKNILKKWTKPRKTGLTPDIELQISEHEERKSLSQFEYVCPRCWYKVESCQCKNYPYFLIQIDKNILEIVRELNKKNYRTGSSCEGHIEKSYPQIQIKFDESYIFNLSFPKGFYYEACGNLLFDIKGETVEERNKIKEEALALLLEWAKSLDYAILKE